MVRSLAVLATLLVTLIVIVWFSTTTTDSNSENPVAIAMTSCALNEESCDVSVFGQPVTLSLLPIGLPTMAPLTLTIKDKGLDLDDVMIWIDGKNMDMGRHFFQPESEKQGARTYKGMIPLCTLGDDMVWEMSIVFSMDGQSLQYDFEMPKGEHK